MKARYRIAGILLLVILLALVRFFEDELFYDPLIDFYRNGYLHDQVPDFDFALLLLNLAFRFCINTGISLLILYVAFFDKNIVKFAGVLYGIIFIVGFIVFGLLVMNLNHMNYMALFYVRRFLIHPVFIIILLPAFYYYRLRTYKY